jgi:hypothetical protein
MLHSTPDTSISLLLKLPKEKPPLTALVNPELIASLTLILSHLILLLARTVQRCLCSALVIAAEVCLWVQNSG